MDSILLKYHHVFLGGELALAASFILFPTSPACQLNVVDGLCYSCFFFIWNRRKTPHLLPIGKASMTSSVVCNLRVRKILSDKSLIWSSHYVSSAKKKIIQYRVALEAMCDRLTAHFSLYRGEDACKTARVDAVQLAGSGNCPFTCI